MGTPIDLIAGLGNPGAKYDTTRHNAGFWFVDLLAREHGASFGADRKLRAETAEIAIAGQRIRLLKPQTYMNLSGESVGAAIRYYKIPAERVLVAYDELDLPAGRVQLKHGGGTAGHNGATNVLEHIGPNFWRLRFGVGHPRDASGARRDVVDHVLTRAAAEEEAQIRDALREASDILPVLLDQGAERAMNRLHSRKRPSKPEKPEKPETAPEGTS